MYIISENGITWTTNFEFQNTSVHVAKYTKMIGMLFSSNIKVRIPESKGLFIINCRVKNTEIFRYMIFTQQISNGSRVDVLSKGIYLQYMVKRSLINVFL